MTRRKLVRAWVRIGQKSLGVTVAFVADSWDQVEEDQEQDQHQRASGCQ